MRGVPLPIPLKKKKKKKRVLIFLRREGPGRNSPPLLSHSLSIHRSTLCTLRGLVHLYVLLPSPSPFEKRTMPLVPACNPRVGLNNNRGDAGFLRIPHSDAPISKRNGLPPRDNGILKWNARYISFGCRPGGREGIMRGWCVSDRIYGRGNSIFFRGRGCIVTRVCRRRFFIEWVYRCGIGQWEFVWIWTSMVGVFEGESIGNGLNRFVGT